MAGNTRKGIENDKIKNEILRKEKKRFDPTRSPNSVFDLKNTVKKSGSTKESRNNFRKLNNVERARSLKQIEGVKDNCTSLPMTYCRFDDYEPFFDQIFKKDFCHVFRFY
uniref:Uncharacterized protein n=1 Tax=Romanomermis culicivorax TaxID=13658 RepID=A0A915HI69_ROMCU